MKMTGRRWLFATVAALGLACMVSIAAEPVTATPDKPITSGTWVTVETNASGPYLSGPFIDLLGNISTWSNLTTAVYGIYDTGSKEGGVGLLALYNMTDWAAGGIGLQYLNKEVWMPSCQVQFQAPIVIAKKVTLVPFGFTGAATPISGRGADNGDLVGIFGAGMAARLYTSSSGSRLDLFGAIAKWSGFEGEQYYGGLAYRF